MENSTFGSEPPLLEVEKYKAIFYEIRPFFDHFLKKVYLPKKHFQKMINLHLGKEIFVSQMSDLTAKCTMMATTHVILAATTTIFGLVSLVCVFRAKGGTYLYMKKISMSKIDF